MGRHFKNDPPVRKSSGFQSFDEFYPFYLGEHSNPVNRKLHIAGTSLVVLLLVVALLFDVRWLWYAPLCGYGFAWVGHFFFEQNRPATFKHPFYSLAGDFRMWFEVLTRKIEC